MGHFVFNVSMISSKMSCSSIYVLFMSYQNLTWKCWDTTYVTSDCNFGNYCRLQYEASFFRKWRSKTYPKSWPKREKRKKKKPTKSKNKKTWCVPILFSCKKKKKKTTLKNVATSLHTISRSCLPLTSLPPILTCRETINLQCHWN